MEQVNNFKHKSNNFNNFFDKITSCNVISLQDILSVHKY